MVRNYAASEKSLANFNTGGGGGGTVKTLLKVDSSVPGDASNQFQHWGQSGRLAIEEIGAV